MTPANEMELKFDSRSANEGFARVAVAAFMTQLNPTVEEVADVKTAVSEAVTNVIIHGYEKEVRKVYIKCMIEENIFTVEVCDQGKGIENIEEAMCPMYTTILRNQIDTISKSELSFFEYAKTPMVRAFSV